MYKATFFLCFCFCFCFISLELSIFFGLLAHNSNGYNGCSEYNCTYIPKKNPNGRDDCWVKLDRNWNNGCFLGIPHCPATTVCWLAPASIYSCPDPECQALDPKISFGILSAFFALIFVLSCLISTYQFNKIIYRSKLYQRIPD